MELRVLEYFLAVAREESISRAAEKLHLTQPTLSRQLKDLEWQLGKTLFVRGGKKITLTEEGRHLCARAQELLNLAKRTEDEIRNSADKNCTISIGSGDYKSNSVLVRIMSELRERYPEVRYRIYNNSSDNIADLLDNGIIDFGLLLEPISLEQYECVRLNCVERWGVLMRSDNLLARRKFIQRSDISSLTLLTSARLSLQNEFQSWLGRSIYELNIYGTYNLLNTAVDIVRRGDASAIAIDCTASTYGGDLVFRPFYPELTTGSVLVWKKYNINTVIAEVFIETAKRICDEDGSGYHKEDNDMNRKTMALITAGAMAVGITSCGSPQKQEKSNQEALMDDTIHVDYNNPIQGNPYLPLWEYTPDVEPYVFEDPDNPGKYRLYAYGSHDMYKDAYCGDDLVVWSAPVENLSDWRYDGVIFESIVEGTADTLYAPDVAVVKENGKKTYYLYPNNQSWGRNGMIAKSDRPDGPFEVANWKNGSTTETDGILGFDPAVFVDDDGEVYGYWGFCESNWAKLDPENMATVKKGEKKHSNIPSYDQMMSENYNPADYNIVQDENVKKWGFFEASSIRKVGNKYVFIFSRNGLYSEPTGKNYNQLAYGYSDSPAGPWKWGGIIVDAQGETIPRSALEYYRTFTGGNTHGSICEINGQWYVFYHRNLHMYARQAMVDKISVEWDEKPVSEGGEVRISMAEMTSQGFYINGLNPYIKTSAGRACYISYTNSGAVIPPAYTQDTESLPVTSIKDGTIVGFKYFNFDLKKSDKATLEVSIKPKSNGSIDVYMRPEGAANTPCKSDESGIISVGEGSVKLCSFKVKGGGDEYITLSKKANISDYSGKWGVFFVFNGEGGDDICDFDSFRFEE